MNKLALKAFATNARKELIKKVEAKAMKIGITEDNIKKADIESSDSIFIDGRQLSKEERFQRDKLIGRIKEMGFSQVMEEVAYTWFNRFIALRFMEINDYLPTGVRVLSSSDPKRTDPDMITLALELDLDLDKQYVYELKLENKTEELFKYLIIKHCNDLNRYLPFMFEMINDYTEILFPEGLLAKDSFIRQMTDQEWIPEADWEKVEIIGWLYQYYISEKKDRVFADLKKNIKITKETLPAATQLFTPHWIVRYLVENSLGRLWLESNPESELKSAWTYYLDEAAQEEAVAEQLRKLQYRNVNPEEIKFLDPSCGSGHILIYAFDLLFDFYLEKGYVKKEIPKLILEKNLFGLDIDNRAVQLASFAVMMKAREKSKRVFEQDIKLNIVAIQESNWMTEEMIDSLLGGETQKDHHALQKNILHYLKDVFYDAKELGSIIRLQEMDWDSINRRLSEYLDEQEDLFASVMKDEIKEKLPPLLLQAKILCGKFDVVCTNPPYMGKNGMGKRLATYLSKHYPDTKIDLFASFIEKGFELTKNGGFTSMVTMQSWMFLSSFSNLRETIVQEKLIHTLLHMDNNVMGIAFGTAATVFRNAHIKGHRGTYTQVKYANITKENEPAHFPISENNNGSVGLEDFTAIPGSPIAYWVKDATRELIKNSTLFKDFAYSFQGMITGNNKEFLRFWFETDFNDNAIGFHDMKSLIKSGKYWIPYNKGGTYRKWYGNHDYVLLWKDDGKHLTRARTENKAYYLKEGITWSFLTSSEFSARYFEKGHLWDVAGSSLFVEDDRFSIYEILAFMNSKVCKYILNIFNPTLNFQVENIIHLPYIESPSDKETIEKLAMENIKISKEDWDSFETSWNFKEHPLLTWRDSSGYIRNAFENWKEYAENRFLRLKSNEEELNRIFIHLYKLEDELEPFENDKEVSIRRADLEKDIKSFISYAVGCMFGRYSLDEKGLMHAGGTFEPDKYQTFKADKDNILPILPGPYFNDDIVSMFVDMVRLAFGEETLTENLDFIADSLGRKREETAKEAIRRYFYNDFFADHVQTYKKHPIYWLFTSGKEKAFNCLVYMHRYDRTTLSRMRTDYLHPYQTRLEAEKKELLHIIEGSSTTKEISKMKKELKVLDKKIEELKAYDEKLHHMADRQIGIHLDDGVKRNYDLFKGLVAKV